MSSLIVLAVVLALGAFLLRTAQSARLRRVSVERIGLQAEDTFGIAAILLPSETVIRKYPTRYYYAAPAAGVLVAAAIRFGTNLPGPYSVGAGILIAAIIYLGENHQADKRIERIEAQLADAIDLMVASLRAGSALVAALEASLREAPMPIRGELEAIVGRIRVGEDPRVVVRELALRVPLESFRLFAHSLLVHWETGGSLASSLRTVGRTVRDRLEVSRRISAQAIESQVSVIAVMGITYGLALFMGNSNPGPYKKLLYSQFGAYAAGGLMVLQAIGIVSIWRMSRIKF